MAPADGHGTFTARPVSLLLAGVMSENLLQDLLKLRLLWVGGKGGVGKTTVAAALGITAARGGRKTLVVSTDPAHSLGDAFDRQLTDKPRRVLPDLDAIELDPDAEVDAHLGRVMAQMRRFASPQMMPELERQMRLSRLSPGAQEAALLERISRLITQTDQDYDLIIFDTAPTGHTLRLLSLPEAMAAWTDGLLRHNQKSQELGEVLRHLSPNSGRDVTSMLDKDEPEASSTDKRTADIAASLLHRRRLFLRARRMLADASQSGFLFVLTPERLPILETSRAVQALSEAGIAVAGAIVNRVLPAEVDGSFLQARRQQEKRYLAEIDATLGQLPLTHLPLLASDIAGLEGLEVVAQLLEQSRFS